MHELSVTRDIIAIVSDAAKGRRVCGVTLEVGKLTCVSAGAIAFAFEAGSQGTMLEGASLDIREIAGRARCEDCGAEFTMQTLYDACPCGSRRLKRLAGEELNVKSIEIEEAA